MSGSRQLWVGVACGLGIATVAGSLMGSAGESDPPTPAGITGYTENGVHYAVTWESHGQVMHPVSKGAMFTSDLTLVQTAQANLGLLASTLESQQDLLNSLQAALGAGTQNERDRYFQKAAGIILAGANCPQCDAEFRACKGSPAECLGRLVLCKKFNCH